MQTPLSLLLERWSEHVKLYPEIAKLLLQESRYVSDKQIVSNLWIAM